MQRPWAFVALFVVISIALSLLAATVVKLAPRFTDTDLEEPLAEVEP